MHERQVFVLKPKNTYQLLNLPLDPGDALFCPVASFTNMV